MSSTISDFKFIHYEPVYLDLNKIFTEFSDTLYNYKIAGEENVNAKILSYFYEGMLYLIKADDLYDNKDYSKALKHYEDGLKLIIRSRASRGVEGDRIFKEMVKWISYSEAKLRVCRARTENKPELQLSNIKEGIEFFKLFSDSRKEENNKIDILIAQSRVAYAQYIHYTILAQSNIDNSKIYKKYLLHARSKLMKANFFFKTLDEEMEELHNKIDETTKLHIITRAEWFWDKGTEDITKSLFNEALRYFAIASKYYTRASGICDNFMEQRLYLALSRITQASRFESEANELYKRKDNPKKASETFLKAVEIVDIALGLLTSIKSKTLINNMTAQRSFYEALSLETEGIYLFDQENFKESQSRFEEAMRKLEETHRNATDGNIDQLLEFVRIAKNEIEGYLSMSNAML
ncbi:MAG: hypothetical protein KGD64_04690 [Candidatus Heimdallarchaeota archaeon]|nr:hypothetical protein [Candidatus Heimdallarchaeota archaeon]